MLEKITKIKEEVEQILNKVENLNELEQIKAKFIGKKGEITILFKELKNFDKEQIKVFGQKLNELKDFTENKVTELREKFQQTFIIATHNKELAAMSDKEIIIKDGIIL